MEKSDLTFEEFKEALEKYERNFNAEEAVLSYKKRQKLPSSAFCGPNRTYPAHDAKHVRNAIARLGTFGNRLPPETRRRIFACLKRRAKRYGIEISEDTLKKYKKTSNETLEWFERIRKKD